MVHRRRVLIAVLAVATVVGIVALQAIDDARSRTPITGSATTTTTSQEPGRFARPASPASICATLGGLVEQTVHALVGDDSVTAEQRRAIARDLRSINRRERLSAPLRVALRKLARFFDRASTGVPITELGATLGQVTTALITVGQYTATTCTTPSTTRPLR